VRYYKLSIFVLVDSSLSSLLLLLASFSDGLDLELLHHVIFGACSWVLCMAALSYLVSSSSYCSQQLTWVDHFFVVRCRLNICHGLTMGLNVLNIVVDLYVESWFVNLDRIVCLTLKSLHLSKH